MKLTKKNIYPVFNQILSKEEKEERLKQNAKCIWLTGLSGSGKTTIAIELERKLFDMGYFVQILALFWSIFWPYFVHILVLFCP